jgi:UDP-N-acetylmuramate--alanine ligase
MGAKITLGHHENNVDEADLVVVSSAIPERNPELRKARAMDLRVLTRGEALAGLLERSKSIVVAGTHGKTTTTSMIVSILRHAGKDPTYLVGGGLNDAGTNARYGRGEYAVAESDESDGSFLLLQPHIGVVTNIEADHLDYWSSIAAIREAFARFVGATDPEGSVIVPVTERDLGTSGPAPAIVFGPGGDVYAENVVSEGVATRFDLYTGSGSVPVHLRVPGMHNVDNALAAAAAVSVTGLDAVEIAAGLGSYRGVERRFQLRGTVDGITVIDDYAHHPTEIRSTLAAARGGDWRRVIAVFQPHRYSRTAAFAREFGASFSDADVIVVTEVYGAGEQPVPGVTGKIVADAVCNELRGRTVAYLPHRDELIGYIRDRARAGDAVLTLGAGDVTLVGEELLMRWASDE